VAVAVAVAVVAATKTPEMEEGEERMIETNKEIKTGIGQKLHLHD